MPKEGLRSLGLFSLETEGSSHFSLQHPYERKQRSRRSSLHPRHHWQDWSWVRLDVRKRLFPQGVVAHWTGSPGMWSRPRAWQSCRSIWATLLDTRCDFWGVLCRARNWAGWSLWVPSNSAYPVILWFCVYALHAYPDNQEMFFLCISRLDFNAQDKRGFYESLFMSVASQYFCVKLFFSFFTEMRLWIKRMFQWKKFC